MAGGGAEEEEEEDSSQHSACGALDFDELEAAEERAAERQPGFRRRLRDVAVGSEVRVLADAALVLRACRAESIPTDHDKLRIASLGLRACVLQKDPGDNTVLCSVPGVGDIWFPLPAVTWPCEDLPGYLDPGASRALAMPGHPEENRIAVRRQLLAGPATRAPVPHRWRQPLRERMARQRLHPLRGPGSLLCYNVARLDLRALAPSVEEGDAVCFCFGEIDCRCHVHKYCQDGRAYQDVIDEIVARYFAYLRAKLQELPPSVRFIVYNIVPPVKMKNMQHNSDRPMHPFIVPFAGSDQDRMEYVNYFNSRLEAECRAGGFVFLDVRGLYALEDGFLDPDLSDGSIHIGDGQPLQELLEQRFRISRAPPLSHLVPA